MILTPDMNANYENLAKERLCEKLLEGGTVNRQHTRDLLDNICQGRGELVRYQELLAIMDDALNLYTRGGDDFLLTAHDIAQRLYDLVVVTYVEDQEGEISDLAAELRRDEEEDAAYERSRE